MIEGPIMMSQQRRFVGGVSNKKAEAYYLSKCVKILLSNLNMRKTLFKIFNKSVIINNSDYPAMVV